MDGEGRARPGPVGPSLDALLVDRVDDYAIFALDLDGHVHSWNRGARRLKGYRADEIVGRSFAVFYEDADRDDGLPQQLLATARERGAVEHQGWRVRSDGTRFWAHVTITALRDDDGELHGYAKVTRDLTQQHQDEEALRQALERERVAVQELERLHLFRRHFLAAIAHDLTTPATVIGAALDLVRDDVADADAELLAHVRRSATTLQDLAQQLREFALLDSGKLELRPDRIELHAFAREVVDELAVLQRDVVTRVEVPADVRVDADPLALRRILCNLLTNAISYSPAGSEVELRSEVVAGQLRIGVLDAGPGIEPGERGSVFDEFWQGPQSGRRAARGLGLGLNIVHQYVHEHGGRIWVDAAPGGGAAFWFTLGPVPVDEDGVPSPDAPTTG